MDHIINKKILTKLFGRLQSIRIARGIDCLNNKDIKLIHKVCKKINLPKNG
jgi:hypothetical protein